MEVYTNSVVLLSVVQKDGFMGKPASNFIRISIYYCKSILHEKWYDKCLLLEGGTILNCLIIFLVLKYK